MWRKHFWQLDPSSQSLSFTATPPVEKGEVYVYEKEDMNRRRDRHDIIAEMLKAAIGGKIKTHLMYELKLNYPQVVDYLDLLVEERLLQNNTIKQKKRVIKVYKTTERGIEFLDHLEFVNKLWSQ